MNPKAKKLFFTDLVQGDCIIFPSEGVVIDKIFTVALKRLSLSTNTIGLSVFI